MELKTVYGDVIFALEGAKTICEVVVAALAAKKSLGSASLGAADLRYAKNITDTVALARFQFIPLEGPFIGWKKVREGILKLCVSKDAKRSHGTERECRCSQAKCLAIYAPGGTELMEAHSEYDESFTYRKGQIAKCIEPFDEDRWNTCCSGIHFYLTREEAENH